MYDNDELPLTSLNDTAIQAFLTALGARGDVERLWEHFQVFFLISRVKLINKQRLSYVLSDVSNLLSTQVDRK